jgi:hypothetical protein
MSFTGEVMDNECGTEKSHDAMMKKDPFPEFMNRQS